MRDGTTSLAEREPPAYEPPRVETVLTPDDLEREVHYAGSPSQAPG